MKETGKTISDWAASTFGIPGTDVRVVSRAMEEMAELIEKATQPVPIADAIAEECADVCIVLARLAYRQGYDLFQLIDLKMARNRRREWRIDGTGHGYHVRELDAAGEKDAG